MPLRKGLYYITSLVAQTVKREPTMWEFRVQSLGWEDPLEKEMATHSRILAWRIPWRSLVGYSPWGCKESDTTERLHFHITIHENVFRYFKVMTVELLPLITKLILKK